MTNSIRRTILALAALAIPALPVTGVLAQTAPSSSSQPASPGPMHHHPETARSALPRGVGQGAFAAIQEIVAILDADPQTDWSKVRLDRLREHLIDMEEVTLHADVQQEAIPGGFTAKVTGAGRTLAAIRRMVPAQAQELEGRHGWRLTTREMPGGVIFTAKSGDPRETAHLRGLGFIGLLASGTHHQRHHLEIARGEPMH